MCLPNHYRYSVNLVIGRADGARAGVTIVKKKTLE